MSAGVCKQASVCGRCAVLEQLGRFVGMPARRSMLLQKKGILAAAVAQRGRHASRQAQELAPTLTSITSFALRQGLSVADCFV